MAGEELGGGIEVGTAYVSIIPSARGFAKALEKGLKDEIDGSALDKALSQKLGRNTITVPIKPKVDDDQLGEALRKLGESSKAKVKVKVDVDKSGLAALQSGLDGLGKFLPGLGGILSGLSDITGAFQKLAGTSTQAGGAIAGGLQAAAGPIATIVGGFIAISAGAALLTTGVALAVPILGAVASALTAAAGAAAAVPAALAGAGAAFATLALGLKGIKEAFAPKAGGGGGGGIDLAARARQVAAAERGIEAGRRGIAAANRTLAASERGLRDALDNVTRAQERAKLAQEAVSKARREAAEDLEDLDRKLRRARITEREADRAVKDAKIALSEAIASQDLAEIERARNALDDAEASLEEAKDTAKDLGEAQAEASKKGVEGSDKVQDALREQADAFRAVKQAQDGVIAAQDAVLSANDGLKASYDALASANDALATAQAKQAAGAAGTAAQLIKLAPNAQKFVDAVKALAPAFDRLRLDVQNRLFKDLDKTVTSMWKAWEDQLGKTLGSFADTFNAFFRDLGKAVSTPKFISDLAIAAEAVRGGLAKVGDVVTSKLIPALGTLAAAAAPFLDTLGDVVADLVADFADWIESANRSGKLQSFFTTASKALKDISVTVKEVIRLVGNLFGIIFRGNGKDDKSAIDSLNEGLDRVNDWLEDPANQQAIQDFLDGWKKKFDDFSKKFDLINDVLGGGPEGKARVSSLGETLGRALISGMIAGIIQSQAALNNAMLLAMLGPVGLIPQVRKWLGIKSPSTVMAAIGVDLMQGLINGIGSMFLSLARTIINIPVVIFGGLRNLGVTMYQLGASWATSLGKGISSLGSWLFRTAWGIGTTVARAIGSTASFMYGVGQSIVTGLWSGIKSLAGWLKANILAFAKWAIPEPLWKFFGIASPSKLMMKMGSQLAEGLAIGIENGAGMVSDAADTMAQAALPALTPGVVVPPSYRAATALPGGMVARWAPGMTGDPILDGLRQAILMTYNGSSSAALDS